MTLFARLPVCECLLSWIIVIEFGPLVGEGGSGYVVTSSI